ncbi:MULTISPECIES: transcription termination/antitermination protein NusG [unclassified Corynebacterium]|uniref:transcription termination/antitermination protein NusG n=1 Tax=Corynebacterium TaxID=1716 RepID=UPI00254B512C|nr:MULTISPECIES: transcription termination/antitermination protein NusG [unclassified Corynebacterium]MDK8451620.1 transcription termination/antitermination protein NusG [Corynebacterium sp. MSK084]MDK8466129.1 transcription termination/antitermination protein NusG [Corynebacterium sp. MSK130]MDK8475745.1 transcription termination/antitermination protein NusG [Corynebacterium sp. MSK310]MDK8513556.1 transcription termination/antitermination protein NusG [Corynebacterium sp. MSK123]MDK8547068.1
MSDENNVENPGTSLEEAMQSNVQEQAAEHASAVEDAQEEAAAPAQADIAGAEDAALADAPAAEAESAEESAAETEEEAEDAAYRKRLREFTRELKKQPGQWYIIQCYSGYENKVRTNLDMRAQTLEVEDSIFEVVVPIEQIMENKDGKKKIVKRKLLPGYVLVRAELNDAAWSVIRETPGVTSFVGNEGNATPVKTRDVAKFLMPNEAPATKGEAAPNEQEGEQVVEMPEKEVAKKYAHDFEVGEAVTILSGPLAAVSATISEIDPETGKMQGLVSIFGRETPVELSPTEIERIS